MADISDLNFRAIASEKPLSVTLLHPLELDKGNEVELEHEGEKMIFEVYAQDSEAYRKIDLIEARKNSNDKLDNIADRVVSIQEANKRKIAACIVKGRLFMDGKWVDVTNKNALSILDDFDWIAEQLLAAMRDREKLVQDAKKK